MKSGLIRKDGEDDPIVTRFQEMVGKFDGLVAANSALHNLVAALPASFDELAKCHTINLEQFSSFRQKTQDALKSAVDMTLNHGLAIGSLGTSLENIKKEFQELKYLYADFTGKIADLKEFQKTFAGLSGVKLLEAGLEELKKNFISNTDANSSQINSSIKACQDLKDLVNSLSSELAKSKNTINTQASTLASLMNELGCVKLSVTTTFHDIKSMVLQKVEEKISQIPTPVIPSLNDAKAAMQSSLEPVILDAQNAKLRSVNNESKILILEKKVEQLQLLLNKYQLQG